MKKSDLEKLKGKKLGGGQPNLRGDAGSAQGKREQAMARKRELLEKSRRPK
jgi:hypothetical protein